MTKLVRGAVTLLRRLPLKFVIPATVGVVAAALGVLVLISGESGGSGATQTITSGPTFARIAPSNRIVLEPTSQFDLGERVSVQARVDVPSGFNGTVQAAMAQAGETPWRLTRDARVARSGWHRVRLPVLADASPRLEACASRQIVVSLRDNGGRTIAQSARVLPPVPPRCGRFFGQNSIWTTPIPDDAGTDKLSSTLVSQLVADVRAGFDGGFRPTINSTKFSAPVYTVPATQRRMKVALTGSRVVFGSRISSMLDEGVPIPDGATPAEGTDRHLVVWQPSTDTMWEFFGAARNGGRWTTQWAGRMNQMSRTAGFFYDPSGIQPGATATSLPLAGGMITQADLMRGEINHALAMAIPRSRYAVWALPARRSDGNVRSPKAIPQGARFRLDPSLDVASLGLPPFTAMLARAAQRYGIYVRDGSPVVTLYAQDPSNLQSNPWPRAFRPSSSELLRAFPWDKLQVLPMDLRGYSGRRVAH